MVLSVRNREVGSHGGNVSLREEGFGFKASAISHALLVQTCSAALRKDVLFCRLEGHLRQAHGESASGGGKVKVLHAGTDTVALKWLCSVCARSQELAHPTPSADLAPFPRGCPLDFYY